MGNGYMLPRRSAKDAGFRISFDETKRKDYGVSPALWASLSRQSSSESRKTQPTGVLMLSYPNR